MTTTVAKQYAEPVQEGPLLRRWRRARQLKHYIFRDCMNNHVEVFRCLARDILSADRQCAAAGHGHPMKRVTLGCQIVV